MSKKRPKAPSGGGHMIWWIGGGAVLAVAVLIGLSLTSANQQAAPPATPPAHVQSDADLGAVRNVWGPENAKVTLVEFGDYL